jgi:hypothetical protein
MESTPNDEKVPKKSCLKRRKVPTPVNEVKPQEDNDATTVDEEIKYHFTDSSESDDNDSADEFPSHFVHKVDEIPSADYRRAFSIKPEEQEKWAHRKAELGPFFPPKNPDVSAVRNRYEAGENLYKRLMDLAWKDSASAQKVCSYEAMRKKINVDATREKYNQPIAKQQPKSKKQYLARADRPSTSQVPADDSSDHASSNETLDRRLQDQYFANVLPTTFPPHKTGIKKNRTPEELTPESAVEPEDSEFS